MSKGQPPGRSQPFAFDSAFAGVSLCFFLSGGAGLLYQVVWMRYLSTVFGTSELAVVTVLVAYMGGLAVGAAIAARLVNSLTRPIRLYAILEAIIALSALLVPLGLRTVAWLHEVALGGQGSPPSDGGLAEAFAFLGLGCFVLFIPTACMGATLPILATGVVRRSEQVGRRVGLLYALNTLGAVFGTVTAAFLLIPSQGLWRTSLVGVALNLTVAVLGWWVALRNVTPSVGQDRPGVAAPSSESPQLGFGRGRKGIILFVMLLSGGISFAYEVLWTRLLAHVLGGSLFAFATMLATFLAGIALGGLLGSRLAVDRRWSGRWLAAAQVGAGLCSALLFLYLGSAAFAARDWGDASLGARFRLCAGLLLPATLCIGATFPLAVRSLTGDPAEAGRAAGRVYAWNTVGAILGAVGAGFFLIPVIGYALTFKWAIVGNLTLGALVMFTLAPRPGVPAFAAAGLVLLGVFFFNPQPPLRLFARSPADEGPSDAADPELIHHVVGHSASVAVLERRGSYLIRTNGLPEAEVFPKGAGKLSYTSIRWLPALPAVLRPETESMLVVGFGGGTLLEAIPPGLKEVDVVELEAGVIEANQFLADRRAIDPLKDERLNVIINDVRGSLRLTGKRYDTIVSQPSHPWTAGASHLYTREFLELARDHLEDNGTFVQWLGASFVDEDLLRSFCASIMAVFPYAQLYLVSDNFVFVGSAEPLADRLFAGSDTGETFFDRSGYRKLSYLEDLLSVLQLDTAGVQKLAAGHPPITDDRNLMATHQSFGAVDNAMNRSGNLRRVLTPIHYLNQNESPLLERASEDRIDFVYLGRLLKQTANHVDLAVFRNRNLPETDRLVLQGLALRARDATKALALFRQALELAPDHRSARVYDTITRIAYLRRRWSAEERGPVPREFASFIAADRWLEEDVARLSRDAQLILEADHWLRTGQFARVRELDRERLAISDHRDPLFTTSAEIILALLLDSTGKANEASERDLRQAASLLDQLLALPLVSNLNFAAKRIALAQHFGDLDYQIAAGWIMARRLVSAPPNTPEVVKNRYRQVLGAIVKPYLVRGGGARGTFSEPEIGRFYREVSRQIGEGVFPEELRR